MSFLPKYLENYAAPLSSVPQRNTTHDVLISLVAPGFCLLLCYMVISVISSSFRFLSCLSSATNHLRFGVCFFCATKLGISEANMAISVSEETATTYYKIVFYSCINIKNLQFIWSYFIDDFFSSLFDHSRFYICSQFLWHCALCIF